MWPDVIRVQIIKADEVQQLQEELQALRQMLDKAIKDRREIESQLEYEVRANNELVDLCRISGVPFRPALERAGKR